MKLNDLQEDLGSFDDSKKVEKILKHLKRIWDNSNDSGYERDDILNDIEQIYFKYANKKIFDD